MLLRRRPTQHPPTILKMIRSNSKIRMMTLTQGQLEVLGSCRKLGVLLHSCTFRNCLPENCHSSKGDRSQFLFLSKFRVRLQRGGLRDASCILKWSRKADWLQRCGGARSAVLNSQRALPRPPNGLPRRALACESDILRVDMSATRSKQSSPLLSRSCWRSSTQTPAASTSS